MNECQQRKYLRYSLLFGRFRAVIQLIWGFAKERLHRWHGVFFLTSSWVSSCKSRFRLFVTGKTCKASLLNTAAPSWCRRWRHFNQWNTTSDERCKRSDCGQKYTGKDPKTAWPNKGAPLLAWEQWSLYIRRRVGHPEDWQAASQGEWVTVPC